MLTVAPLEGTRDNRRDQHRPHGCSADRLQTFCKRFGPSLQTLCKRPTVETPRNRAKRLTRSPVFSGFLAHVRWVSRNMNLSGSTVQVGFPKPYSAVLRPVCGHASPPPCRASVSRSQASPPAHNRALSALFPAQPVPCHLATPGSELRPYLLDPISEMNADARHVLSVQRAAMHDHVS